MPELFYCERRNEIKSSLPAQPPRDEWIHDRWDQSGTRWPTEHDHLKPRVCSYCGGAHPDDVARLLNEGDWQVSLTDKNYKAYIEQPRYYCKATAMDLNPTKTTSPVPPVKVYYSHWDRDLLSRNINLLEHNQECGRK